MLSTYATAETVNRIVKESLDSGRASSLDEAEALFQGYRLEFSLDTGEVHDPIHQAALLTGVALARRVFLGGVSVIGNLNVPLRVPMPLGTTLGEAVGKLGGVPMAETGNGPLISIGGGPRPKSEGFHVRTQCGGWRGGVVPAHSEVAPAGAVTMPLAAMLAAALAVNEAFLYVRRENGVAGRRSLGLSLWDPSPSCDWLSGDVREPELRYLPTRLWLLGLGHLGQAFLWGLGLLPYPVPTGLELVLQDIDVITPSSESTSILTEPGAVGRKKTREMAAWAERRGFATSIQERLFDSTFRRQASEPAIVLCGLDNALGRRALDGAGFDLVVEAGLGRNYRDFRSIRLHTLPGSRTAATLWKDGETGEVVEGRAAYQKMLEDGDLDRCGVTLLAGKAVGAPFVGSVGACLALSEVLRQLHGGPIHQVIDLDLQSIDQRSAVLNGSDFSGLNPGYAEIG
jgi:hypothetical protein